MPGSTIKEEAHAPIDRRADDATWEDIQYAIYVHRSIEAGLKDCEDGRLVSMDEVRRRFNRGPQVTADFRSPLT